MAGSGYLFFMDRKLRTLKLREEEMYAELDKFNNEWCQLGEAERAVVKEECKEAMDTGYRIRPRTTKLIRYLCETTKTDVPRSRKPTKGSANKLNIPTRVNELFGQSEGEKRTLTDRWQIDYKDDPMGILNATFFMTVFSYDDAPNLDRFEMACVVFNLRAGIVGAFERKYPCKITSKVLIDIAEEMETNLMQRFMDLDVVTPMLNYPLCEEKMKRAQAAKYPINDSVSVTVVCLESLIQALCDWMKQNGEQSSGLDVDSLKWQPYASTMDVMCADHVAKLPDFERREICAMQWAVFSACKVVNVLQTMYPKVPLCSNPGRFFADEYRIQKSKEQ